MTKFRKWFKLGDERFVELLQLEGAILSALIRAGGTNYAAAVLADMKSDGTLDGDVRVGRLYEALDRLHKDFALIERGREEPGANGTTRKFWKINGDGVATLAANTSWWLQRQILPRGGVA